MLHEHFSELKEWSERKHALLMNYLKGFARILGGASKSFVYYVDGFAGPGIYEDGAKGSPIRAAEYAQSLIDTGAHYNLYCINVETDPSCFANLEQNTRSCSTVTQNYYGTFGEHVDRVLERIGDHPAIFFLDPFGLKGIEWRHIYPILKRSDKTEVLLRINPKDLGRLAGFACSDSAGADKKCQILTDLYGFEVATEWQDTWYSSETRGLVDLYIRRLVDAMGQVGGRAYVCSYAIRSIDGQLKYNLLFATRHPKGAILMSNIVYGIERRYEQDVKEYEEERLAQRSVQQMTMFDLIDSSAPTENDIFAAVTARLKQDIWHEFAGKRVSRQDIHVAMLPKWFGRVNARHFTRALKELEEEDKITDRTGVPSGDYSRFVFQRPLAS